MLLEVARAVRAGCAARTRRSGRGTCGARRGVPVPAPGAQRRQGRAHRAGAAGPGRHGADHRWHGRPGRGVRPAPGRSSTASGTCCWSAAAGRPPTGAARAGRRAGRAGRRRRGWRPATWPTGTSWPRCSASLEHPLTAVVHAAGVLDDGVLESLTPERLRPGAAAEGRRGRAPARADRGIGPVGVRAVLLGGRAARQPGAGQLRGGQRVPRRAGAARGGPRACRPVSLAWGLWADASGMTGGLGDADLARLERMGVGALPAELGLELFDERARLDEALLVPVRLDLARAAGAGPGRVAAAAAARPGPGAGPRRGAGSGRDRWRSGWPACRTPTGSGSCWSWCGRRSRRCSGTRPPAAIDPDRAFKDLGLRLAERGRAAQPADPGQRPAAAGDAGLRPPDPRGGRPAPAGRGRRGRGGDRAGGGRPAGRARRRTSRSRSSG